MEWTAVLMGDMSMKNGNNQSELVFCFFFVFFFYISGNLIEICLHILFDVNMKLSL